MGQRSKHKTNIGCLIHKCGAPVKIKGFPDGSAGKESACNAGDTGDAASILGLGRSPGGENSNPLQHFCLGNLKDRAAWWFTVQRVSNSLKGHKESDTTEGLSIYA